jgi:hypothetical protein
MSSGGTPTRRGAFVTAPGWDLVREGAIGTLRVFDVAFHFGPDWSSPLTPWSWFDSLALGGGC